MNIAKKIIYCAVFVAVFVGVWNLFDFLLATFITGSGYAFSASDIIYPAALGAAMYLVLFVVIKKKK